MYVPNLNWAPDLFAAGELTACGDGDATGNEAPSPAVDPLWSDMTGCWSHGSARAGVSTKSRFQLVAAA